MERAAVSAATGALAPVLEKLTGFLGEERALPEGSKSDIIFIKSELERLLFLLRKWGREDLDAPCKHWVTEVRELSYDMEDAIDDFAQKRTSESPFEELTIRVKDVLERSCEEWWTAETISNTNNPVIADPRSRFVHKDASELVGMEELKEELVKLVVQGVYKRGDASRRCIVTPSDAITNAAHVEKAFKLSVNMHSARSRSKTMALVARTSGVTPVNIVGDRLVVDGNNMDRVGFVAAVEKVSPMFGSSYATNWLLATFWYKRSDENEIKTVCILGFAGVGKTALAELVFQAGEQFDCRAFVSVSPTPNITEILRAILKQVTNAPYARTGAVAEQYLIQEISNFLANRRYLIIIDDIWHWEEWEIIRNSLPKNNPGSRIIITTRINAIAEKCRTGDNDAFVYEIGALDAADAWKLTQSVLPRYEIEALDAADAWKPTQSVLPRVADINDVYQWDLVEMCSGVPLALICMSPALEEQRVGVDGELEEMRALRRVEDGILNIASLRPLAESLCLGYNDLPLHLRTCLLYCSLYSRHHTFEKDRLVMRWIAERFVYEEEAAEGYFDDLVDREWIKPVASGKYEIHPVMLAFLRCKSQEDNFVTRLDSCSDISSSKQIRRLSLQVEDGDSVDISGIDLSHTRSLSVFGSASAVPFKQFERLRVLELEDVKDLENDHMVDICGLLRLRHLGLMGTPITELPPQIGRLLHLETLDVRDTGVAELPWEAAVVVRVLAGDRESHQVIELPEGVCQALQSIPASLRCRETLSVLLSHHFGSGTVFKVHGTRTHIPGWIKEHFKFLPSLDIRLCVVEDDDLKFLQEMPNLKTLILRFEVVPAKSVTIGSAHLVEICGMLRLRHLGLMGTPITELPPAIGRMPHLETLDVRDTGIAELPWEAGKLSKSVRVFAGDKDSHQGIELPVGVCQNLEDGIPEDSLVKCREVLSIQLLSDRFGLGTVPLGVGVFKVPGRRRDIPELIKEHFKVLSSLDIRLFKLEKTDLEFLQEMPNLKTLVLRFEVVPVEPITIGSAGFRMIESFCVDSRVPRVTFEQGAMRMLKRLAFKFHAGPASENSMGITHLESLEVVVFRCSPWYKSDSPGISATISVVRREAGEHPNRIILCINDKEEIFPEKLSAQVCSGDAGSSWTSWIEAIKADIFCADWNRLDGNAAIASYSRPIEIEEVYWFLREFLKEC